MSIPEFNPALAEEILGRIIANPEQHTQHAWRCETGQCFAGWAPVVTGVPWLTKNAYGPGATLVLSNYGRRLVRHTMTKETLEEFQASGKIDPAVTLDTQVEGVSTYAERVLGLTHNEANMMFSAGNTREDLANMVKILSNGKGIAREFDRRTNAGTLVESPVRI